MRKEKRNVSDPNSAVETIRLLMTPPDPPKRPIGFVTDDKASKSKAAKGKR